MGVQEVCTLDSKLSLSLYTATGDLTTLSLAMLEVLPGQDREESRRLVARALDAFVIIVVCALAGRRVNLVLFFFVLSGRDPNALPASSVMNWKKCELPGGGICCELSYSAWLRSDRRSTAGTDTQHQTLL